MLNIMDKLMYISFGIMICCALFAIFYKEDKDTKIDNMYNSTNKQADKEFVEELLRRLNTLNAIVDRHTIQLNKIEYEFKHGNNKNKDKEID